MRRQSSWERKFKLYCPLFRTPLAWWPNFYGFAHFGTQIKGGSRRHTVTSAAITILNQLGYEHHSNCSAHCTRMSTLPLIWLEFADENKESTVVKQLLLTWFRRHSLPLVTKTIGMEVLRHTRARVAANFWEKDFRHEAFPFAAVRISVRSATRLWATNEISLRDFQNGYLLTGILD